MKDEKLQSALARLMLVGTFIAAGVICVGLAWYLVSRANLRPGDHTFSAPDHLFTGEPKYFENPISMVERAWNLSDYGHRRSLIMIGVVLLLINPVVRVAFAAFGYGAQKDRLYFAISLVVFGVLLVSFFA